MAKILNEPDSQADTHGKCQRRQSHANPSPHHRSNPRTADHQRDQPQLTFVGMVAALGITRSTIQKHIANLKKAGRLRRVGPDKGGQWEVV